MVAYEMLDAVAWVRLPGPWADGWVPSPASWPTTPATVTVVFSYE